MKKKDPVIPSEPNQVAKDYPGRLPTFTQGALGSDSENGSWKKYADAVIPV
jgi:hypothetical protein